MPVARNLPKLYKETIIATSIKLDDTDGSNYLTLDWNEDDNADRLLYFKVNAGNRTIDLSGNLTLSGANQVVNWDFSDGTDTHTIKAIQETGLGGRLTIGLDETARSMVICDIGDIDTDLGLVAQGNNTLYIFNASADVYSKLSYSAFGLYDDYCTIDYSSSEFRFRTRAAEGFTFEQLTTNIVAGHLYNFLSAANTELTDSDGEQAWMYLRPYINQTSTANYVGFLMDVTQTQVGSGNNRLMDLRVATVSKFAVSNAGTATVAAEYDNGNSSTADTIDWNNGNNQKSTLTGNCTFTFTAPTTGTGTLKLKLIQDGTGSRTVTWPGTVKWPSNGTAPTLSTGAGEIDVVAFYWDGTNYYGNASLDFA